MIDRVNYEASGVYIQVNCKQTKKLAKLLKKYPKTKPTKKYDILLKKNTLQPSSFAITVAFPTEHSSPLYIACKILPQIIAETNVTIIPMILIISVVITIIAATIVTIMSTILIISIVIMLIAATNVTKLS